MALFRPADDEVGLGVISRLWIDKMNQFRCRGGKAHHGQAGPAGQLVLVIVANLANYVTLKRKEKFWQESTGLELME